MLHFMPDEKRSWDAQHAPRMCSIIYDIICSLNYERLFSGRAYTFKRTRLEGLTTKPFSRWGGSIIPFPRFISFSRRISLSLALSPHYTPISLWHSTHTAIQPNHSLRTVQRWRKIVCGRPLCRGCGSNEQRGYAWYSVMVHRKPNFCIISFGRRRRRLDEGDKSFYDERSTAAMMQ